MSYLEEHGGMGIWERAAWEKIDKKSELKKEIEHIEKTEKIISTNQLHTMKKLNEVIDTQNKIIDILHTLGRIINEY